VRVLLARRHGTPARGGATRVLAAYADPHRPWLETATLEDQAQLVDLDLAALGAGRSLGLTVDTGPVFGVCTHGRHDACCAELGRPTAAALAAAHPDRTWEVSHVGGDRFAANVLVLPAGLYYGRVPPGRAAALADGHLDGHLDLDLLRGRSGFAFPVQAAEVALRRELGDTRVTGCRLVAVTTSGSDSTVVLDLAGTSYTVRLRRTESERPARLTCRAGRESPVPSFEVAALDVSAR
ncbi:MAG: sucrase ferredoxin, partial [Nocardioidaceae bacterium]